MDVRIYCPRQPAEARPPYVAHIPRGAWHAIYHSFSFCAVVLISFSLADFRLRKNPQIC